MLDGGNKWVNFQQQITNTFCFIIVLVILIGIGMELDNSSHFLVFELS